MLINGKHAIPRCSRISAVTLLKKTIQIIIVCLISSKISALALVKIAIWMKLPPRSMKVAMIWLCFGQSVNKKKSSNSKSRWCSNNRSKSIKSLAQAMLPAQTGNGPGKCKMKSSRNKMMVFSKKKQFR
jgi:hypothetical protein